MLLNLNGQIDSTRHVGTAMQTCQVLQADLLCKAEEQAVVLPAAMHTPTLPRPQAGTPAGRAVSAALPKGVRTSKTAFEVAQAELAGLQSRQPANRLPCQVLR